MIRKRISIEGNRITKYFNTELKGKEWLEGMRRKHSDPSLDGEVWLLIPNYSKYEASNYGRLRSLNYKNSGMTKVLKPCIDKGYYQTMIQNDSGKYDTVKVHRLIATTYHGLHEDLVVNHLDGVKTNNNADNLEWCTQSENCIHSFAMGLQKPKRGELNGMAKLTKEQVRHARHLKATKGRFWGRNELAKEYGINAKHLQRIVNNPTASWYNI